MKKYTKHMIVESIITRNRYVISYNCADDFQRDMSFMRESKIFSLISVCPTEVKGARK